MRAIDSLLTFMEEKSYHKAQQRVTLGRKDATKTFRITCADSKSVTKENDCRKWQVNFI